jgi:hypothetical protein
VTSLSHETVAWQDFDFPIHFSSILLLSLLMAIVFFSLAGKLIVLHGALYCFNVRPFPKLGGNRYVRPELRPTSLSVLKTLKE